MPGVELRGRCLRLDSERRKKLDGTRLRGQRDDISHPYMDFTVSYKHAVLPDARPINDTYDWLTEAIEQLAPGGRMVRSAE